MKFARIAPAFATAGIIALVGLGMASAAHADTTTTTTPKTFVAALWLIPGGDIEHAFAAPQKLVDHVTVNTTDVQEAQVSLRQKVQCGSAYQLDIYLDDATTAELLARGILTAANNPTEHLAGPASYTVFSTEECEVVPSPTPTPTGSASPPATPPATPSSSPSATPSPSASVPTTTAPSKPVESPSPKPTSAATLVTPSGTPTNAVVAGSASRLAYTGSSPLLPVLGFLGLTLVLLGIVSLVLRRAEKHEAGKRTR